MELPAIDWDVAARTGRKLAPPGPKLHPDQIAEVTDALHATASAAGEVMTEVTALQNPAEASVRVVDRGSWIAAMSESAAALLAELSPSETRGGFQQVRAKALGVQAAGVFAVMAHRILGQFDPFVTPSRLLLVAPNVVSMERELGLVPADFRLWVCLHEQTHRLQFGQAPWLKGHLLGLVTELMADSEDLVLGSGGVGGFGLRFNSESQQSVFDRVTAVMSLLEGHADVMMDRAGVAVVPTLATIRGGFEERRDRGGWSALIGRVLGLDLKREQYRSGAGFCRQVLAAADLETLNQAFSDPALLPTAAEIAEPANWLQRL